MPYFVFKIDADRRLEHLETFGVFREAMQFCRARRAAQAPGEDYTVRMVFAQDVTEARRLLGTPRPNSPVEEWEV